MTILGELQVNLVANTKKLVSGFKKGIKATKSFVDSSKKLWKQYGKSVKNITGGVVGGLGGIALLTKNLAAAGAENVRFARTLGLTVQQLEAFQSGARKMNVNADAMGDGLRELSKRSAEATTGTGSMFDALQMMNIEVDKFSKMKLWDQYALISKELDNMDDVARRNFLSDEIFGGTFADVATGLEGSIKGLADQFVRLDKGTGEGAATSILSLDNKIKDLTATLTKLGKGFLIDISDPAIAAVEGLRIVMEEAGLISKPGAAKTGGASLIEGYTNFTDWIGRMYTGGSLTSDASLSQRFTNQLTDQQIMERQQLQALRHIESKLSQEEPSHVN